MLKDRFGRKIDYLRISVTDKCNYRCVYCMPEDGVNLKSHEEILSFEELEKLSEERGSLYLYNKLKGVDTITADKIHPNDKKRIIRNPKEARVQ